jgi:putative transcriptional regulator
MPRSEKELSVRDAKRDIDKELLQAIRDVKAGRHGARYEVDSIDVAATRERTGLSQNPFAAALHISARTLQHWE